MQNELFDDEQASSSIAGLVYEPEFLSAGEEAYLLEVIKTLPLRAAQYKEYLARRQALSFGGSYNFSTNTVQPSLALDERLVRLRNRVAQWLDVPSTKLVQALVAKYEPGTPLGWHRDVPDYELIAGVSLGNAALLRFRPYPPDDSAKKRVVQLEVAPRSIYKMQGEARWAWQHCVPPVKEPRWSITFRTARHGR